MKGKINDIIKYLLVGGIATIVEWGTFGVIFSLFHIQYLVATAVSFVFSTFANWLFGRLLLFKGRDSIVKEIVEVYFASSFGLLFNLIIMYLLVQFIMCDEMLSKIIATIIVFAYNYLVRKYVIYK